MDLDNLKIIHPPTGKSGTKIKKILFERGEEATDNTFDMKLNINLLLRERRREVTDINLVGNAAKSSSNSLAGAGIIYSFGIKTQNKVRQIL